MRRVFSVLLCALLLVSLLPTGNTRALGEVWDGGADQPAGAGSFGDPYRISTARELKWFADEVNGLHPDNPAPTGEKSCAKLYGDIRLNDTSLWTGGIPDAGARAWTPVGYGLARRYKGVFDGGGYTVSGLYINAPGENYRGMFGILTNDGSVGTVQNLRVADSYVRGQDNVGAVCGQMYLGGVVRDCESAATVIGRNYAGGIAGQMFSGSVISGCRNTGSVTGRFAAGGILGQNTGGTLFLCANLGPVTLEFNYGGGVVGFNNSGVLNDSYNTGTVTGPGTGNGVAALGGVCGSNTAAIARVYSTGAVANGVYVGRICGTTSSSVTESYFLGTDADRGFGTAQGTAQAYPMSGAQFASGEAAWRLGAAFGQTLGTDVYPVFRAASGANAVYRLLYKADGAEYAVQYYNAGNAITPPVNPPDKPEGGFSGWTGMPAGPVMPVGDLEVNAAFNKPPAPVLSPNAVDCYTAGIAAVTVKVTWSGSAGTVTAVKDGLTPLTPGTDYTVSYTASEAALTLQTAYLSVLTPGSRAIAIELDTGDSLTLTLRILVTLPLPVPTGLAWHSTTAGRAVWTTVPNAAAYRVTLYKDGTAAAVAVRTTPSLWQDFITDIETAGDGRYTFTVEALGNGMLYGDSPAAVSAGGYDYTAPEIPSGTGVKTDPYRIYTAAQLKWFASRVNSGNNNICGVLMNDISLNGANTGWENWGTTPPAYEWTPIGIGNTVFYQGTFDGQGYAIRGVYINQPGKERQGLFAWTVGADIKNLRVENSYIRGMNFVGGICGYNSSAKLSNLVFNGIVSSSATGNEGFLGGICGYNYGTLENCAAGGLVDGAAAKNVGGVCGSNGGTLRNVSNNAEVRSTNVFVGGVCGGNKGTLEYAVNTGAVSGSYSTGGICGSNMQDGIVRTAYNLGAVTGDYPGGICGSNSQLASASPTLQAVYNLGTVTGSGASGICGKNDKGIIIMGYYLPPLPGVWFDDPLVPTVVVSKNMDQFASGEVAWLMVAAFGQTIGTDTHPVFRAADNANAVYRILYMNNAADYAMQYYNAGNLVTRPAIDPVSPVGTFTGWGNLPEFMPARDVTATALFETPPTAKIPVPAITLLPGDSASFTAANIAQDADGDALTITAIVTPPAATASAALAGGTVTVTGLTAGSTSVTVRVSDGKNTVDVTVPITVNARTYLLAWEGAAPKFPSLVYGYSTGSSATFTVKNTGNSTVSGINCLMTTPGGGFDYGSNNIPINFMPNGTATVQIVSKANLPAKTYSGTLKITWDGNTTGISQPFSLTVNKADQAAPAGLTGVAESVQGQNDGQITGVTDKMEYKPAANSTYTAVSGTEITGLAPGTYHVRFRETDNYKAGADATVTVAPGAVPTYIVAWEGAAPTFAALVYGYSTGNSATFTVKNTGNSPVNGLTYTIVTPKGGFNFGSNSIPINFMPNSTTTIEIVSISNLPVGTYTGTLIVTWTGNTTGISQPLSLTVNKADQAAPVGVTSVAESVQGQNDGKITGVTDTMEYKPAADSTYTAVGGTEITNLAPGTYHVRYRETANYKTGADATITVAPGAVATYLLDWEGAAPVFTPLVYGYSTGSSATFTVKNTGNSPVSGIQVGLTPSDGEFVLGSIPATLTPGATGTVTVSSASDLPAGTYLATLTVTWDTNATGITQPLSLTVNKADQAAPVGVTGVTESVQGQNDGKITGVTDTMEYKPAADSTYTAVSGTEITNLAPGTYHVRLRETENLNAGADAIITVAPGLSATCVIRSAAGEGGSIRPAGIRTLPRGGSQTYHITPAAGYAVARVLVDGVDVGIRTLYTFTNVQADHSIRAEFTAIPVNPPPPDPEDSADETAKDTGKDNGQEPTPGEDWVNPYIDVRSDAWYFSAVRFVSRRGLFQGTGGGHFSPAEGMTRGMFVTVLWRLAGENSGAYENPFTDVVPGMWYEQAVAWAAAEGIVNGVGGGRFAPDEAVSREQIAVLLYNFAKSLGLDVSVGEDTNILSYNDAFGISEYAVAALQWACGTGILRGDEQGNLNPTASATRAETAAMLERFVKWME